MAYVPKQLVIDIENFMSLGYFWGKVHDTSIVSVKEPSYIMSMAYSWYPSKRVEVLALCDYEGYKSGRDREENLIQDIFKLLNEADVIVGQNSDSFDLKHIYTRGAFYGLTPPKPRPTVDTLKKLRQVFNLPSNKLDYVCNYFNLGGKLPNTGKDLWLGCDAGNFDDWKMMKKYNAHDVALTNKLYTLLLPWGKHPNMNLITDGEGCPACGSKIKERRGYRRTLSRLFTRYCCLNCGKWYSDKGEPARSVGMRPL